MRPQDYEQNPFFRTHKSICSKQAATQKLEALLCTACMHKAFQTIDKSNARLLKDHVHDQKLSVCSCITVHHYVTLAKVI